MANHLDLEEQEQLDQLKHFWQQYGNFITLVVFAVLATVAAWNGYQWWQRSQAAQAAAMYDEVERMVASGDVEKAERAFADMRARFSSTVYAPQAGLLVAKMAYDAEKKDVARAALAWVSESASDKGLASIARLRLAGVLMDAKSYDEALKLLAGEQAPEFAALVADRTGDIYMLQDKRDQAKSEYQKAYKLLDDRIDYRRLVEVKLSALGVAAQKSESAK